MVCRPARLIPYWSDRSEFRSSLTSDQRQPAPGVLVQIVSLVWAQTGPSEPAKDPRHDWFGTVGAEKSGRLVGSCRGWEVGPSLWAPVPTITGAMIEFLLLLAALLRATLRTRADVAAENLPLRHQLAVLTRPTPWRPRLRTRDKLLWVLAPLARRDWRQHLVLVRPETVVQWHGRAGGCSGAGDRAGRWAAPGSEPRCGT
jgi:hypothetical protein